MIFQIRIFRIFILILFLTLTSFLQCQGGAIKSELDELEPKQQHDQRNNGVSGRNDGCPLCDSSVYSYCSYRLVHDMCCCERNVDPYLPPECQCADCQFLYAKSCYEHSLIKRCCCDRL